MAIVGRGHSRPQPGFFNGRRPKKRQQKQDKQQKKQNSASRNQKRTNNNKPHKKQQTARAAASCTNSSNSTKQQQHSSTNSRMSGKNIQMRSKIGFSTVSDLQAPAAPAATKQQKEHEQQEKQHTTRKASIKQQQKMAKTAHIATKAVQTLWKVKSGKGVFFNTTTAAKRPECGEVKNRKIKAKRCGASRGGQKPPINCEKLWSTFWKVKHCKGGRGGSTVGGPKAATRNAAESGANQHKQQPRNSEGCPVEGGSRGGSPNSGAPKCRGPEVSGAPKGGRGQNFTKFFPLPPLFSFFLPLLEVVLWNWWCD